MLFPLDFSLTCWGQVQWQEKMRFENESLHTTTLAARMENPVRVRLDLPPAPGSGAALCRGLRASSRRYYSPSRQIQQPGRTQDWIKPGGKVTRLSATVEIIPAEEQARLASQRHPMLSAR